MLTPAVANYVTQFYPLGNTPAVSLTRGIPQGADADILLLGCGDIRNVLFTAYSNKGFPSRRLDITCCDYEPAIIARNVFLLSLLIDEKHNTNLTTAWNVYYDLYLGKSSASLVQAHTSKLLGVSQSLGGWRRSRYGAILSFCDDTTLNLVRDVWSHMTSTSSNSEDKTAFEKELQRSRDMLAAKSGSTDPVLMTGLRSASPLRSVSQSQLPDAFRHFWKNGSHTESKADIPNPLFSTVLSPHRFLHYGTDPLLGYHLATAFANLAPLSPLRPESLNQEGHLAVIEAASMQFKEWISAFQAVSEQSLKLRFVVAEALTFCHVLRTTRNTGTTTTNVYRRQFDTSACDLDPEEYGPPGHAPQMFDVVDTSNLADHVGTLNLLIAATPLLKDVASSSLYMETSLRTDETGQDQLGKLLCGHSTTVSLLLGVIAVEQWTNAITTSFVEEMVMNMTLSGNEELQVHSRLSWKMSNHFSPRCDSVGLVRIEPEALTMALFKIYLNMFEHENPDGMMNLSSVELRQKMHNSAYPKFHRGTLPALIEVMSTRVNSDWPIVYTGLIQLISQDRSLVLGNLYVQELALQFHLQGLYTAAWLKDGVHRQPSLGGFNAWDVIPEAVVLTLVVPRKQFNKLYATKGAQINAPTMQAILSSAFPDSWQNMFVDMHMVFGQVQTSGDRSDDNFSISIQQDVAGWSGNSPLVVSFYVPSSALQVEQRSARIGLGVQTTAQNLMVFKDACQGPGLTIYETIIGDPLRVFITKHQPGMKGHPIIFRGDDRSNAANKCVTEQTPVSAIIDEVSGKVVSLTGRANILTEMGKTLLANKVPIELRQPSPFIIEIVFGKDELVYPIRFPVPVAKETSKTRIARKSAYVEVILSIADPLSAESLSDFVFPVILGADSMPVTLHSDHMNLNTLPILNVEAEHKKDNRWLTTLTSNQFSAREKRIRDSGQNDQGISANLRLNFKESLFTMFMLASGLQGGQTGLFSLQRPDKSNVILIFVQSIRLDGAAGSVVLDAAILPLTMDLVKSEKLNTFFLLLRELEMCAINVNDEELNLWKRVIPTFVERCRTWSHTADCEYKNPDATIPLSLKDGDQLLCSCGNGKLPENFTSIPDWHEASQYAVRAAISPIFATPFVDDIIDVDMLKLIGRTEDLEVEMCRKCAKTGSADGGKLLRCSRCREVAYCSRDCQKADWKKHRMECSSE